MYAGRKRRKPVQRTVKQTPTEGVKSNPSKRHRDRLNSELDRLAGLLPFPEEVTSSLDKLSILRLSVSYLRTKSFFNVALKNHACKGLTANIGNHDNSKAPGLVDSRMPEGELLLQALNGFVLVITAEGIIFYCSHTIQDYLGFQQTDVMHQSVFELIHTEDQEEFRGNLHWALNPPSLAEPKGTSQDGDLVASSTLVTYNPDQLPPENSSFLERNFVCRFRCLLDNSSGFLALNLQGRLKFLHGQNQRMEDGFRVPPQLALFAIATPLQSPSILEIRTRNMIFRTKHKLDFTPMACDTKGEIVLGYTEAELRVRGSGYQFIHAADMVHCAENHVRMIKTGESGLTVFRLLTKENSWKWVQANARLVYKNGKPDHIICTQRPLMEEEGGEHLQKRSMHLPFTFATGEALLYQNSLPSPGCPDTSLGKGKSGKVKKGKSNKASTLDPSSLLGAFMRQDESVYVCQPALEPKLPYHGSLFDGQSGSGGFPAPSVGGNWSTPPNGVAEPKPELSSFDPLPAILDSLSLDGDDSCSNSELFSALENLGLNAEDLELLLLDERMIRVEIDPDYVPSLNDLLTNSEILSYVHDSLEARPEVGGAGGDCQKPRPLPPAAQSLGLPQVTDICPVPTTQYLPYGQQGQPSKTQLSHQTRRHSLTETAQVKVDTWSQWAEPQSMHTHPRHTEVLPTENGEPHNEQPLKNSQWVAPEPAPLRKVTQEALEPSLQQQYKPQEQQWQQNQVLIQLQSQCNYKHSGTSDVASLNGVCKSLGQHPVANLQWPGHSNSGLVSLHNQTEPGSFHNGLGAADAVSQPGPLHANSGGASHMDYSAVNNAAVDLNGETRHYQGLMASASSFQGFHQRQQLPLADPAEVLFMCQSQNFQNTSLGFGPPQQLPSLETYGILTTMVPQETTNSRMENGHPLNSTSVAYTGGRLLPDMSSTVPTDAPHACPDVLPSLPDPQATGFFF